MTTTINLFGFSCIPVFRRYADNDRIAILLRTPEGEPVATATVNQPDFNLKPNLSLIHI